MTPGAKSLLTSAAIHVACGCSGPTTQARTQTPPANRVSIPRLPEANEYAKSDALVMNEGYFCLTRDVRARRRTIGILNSAQPFSLEFFAQDAKSLWLQQYFVTLRKNQSFSASVTLESNGITAVLTNEILVLEDSSAIRNIEDGRRGKSQACSVVGARVEHLLIRAAAAMQLVSPSICRHRRYQDHLPESDCLFVKDRGKATARLNVGFDAPSSRIGSLVVASGRLGLHALRSNGLVACSPMQVTSKDQTLVASLATMPSSSDPNGYAIAELEVEGCVGVVVGTIQGPELSQSGLQALLDATGGDP